MPPVTLTAASAATTVDLASTAPALAPCTPPAVPAGTAPGASGITAHAGQRPALRLVPTGGRPGEIVHGRGGPSSCGCRECAMARHPASMPRLTVVR